MMDELVSIIMPAHNSSATIERSINSVINQTYEKWELLISDDFSTDNTVKIVKAIQQNESRIRLISSNINNGAAVTRNNAIRLAKGRYIAFLDSDDTWEERKLELQISFMKANSYDFTYTHYFVYKPNGRLVPYRPRSKVSYRQCLFHNPIGCLTAIYDVERLGKIYMPEQAFKREDYATWLDILRRIKYAYCYD